MNTHGSHWIRPQRRLAIYLRDGMACCWCGATVEDGEALTLDHLRPTSRGGSNDSANLVTACKRCNSARDNRSVREFAVAVAGYLNHDTNPQQIVDYLTRQRRRATKLAEAQRLIADRRA